MTNKLEMIYLMNVALYLENKYDAFTFIQINKKCQQRLSYQYKSLIIKNA